MKGQRVVPHFHFVFPNTLWGRLKLWLVKHWVNKEFYSVSTRFRGPRYGQRDAKRENATAFRVYLRDKRRLAFKGCDHCGREWSVKVEKSF